MGFVPPIFVAPPTRDADDAAELAAWAKALPRPRAILALSAGWQELVVTRGSTRPRRTMYAAPGAPELAHEVHALLPMERSSRNWDHGVWAPLVHMFPDAGIPVLQLSLVLGATPRRLYALGRKLGVLADRGVLVMGSGRITHSPTEMDARVDAAPLPWAREFDGWVANQLADSEVESLLEWRVAAPHARRAHPTSEQIDPLFVVAGAASLYDNAVGFPVRGIEHGVMSRRCVQFGR